MPHAEKYSENKDYVVGKSGFRGYPHGRQLRLHLIDAEQGVYRLKNSDDTFTAAELEIVLQKGELQEI